MLTEVILVSTNPMTLNIEDVDPDDLIVVKSISGLSPADVDLFTGDFAEDGGYYQGRRVVKRNPVFTFKLNPDYANDIEVSDIREMLYAQFYEPGSPEDGEGDGLKVVLKDDRKPDRYFVCYTEKTEFDLFSKSTDIQISTVCPSPYLLSVNPTAQVNPSGWIELPLDYDGSAYTGCQLELRVVTATTTINVSIGAKTMALQGSFAVGDVVSIGTIPGSRYIRKNGNDILGSLLPGSQWLTVDKNQDKVRVAGSTWGDGKVVLTSYTCQSRWWGI